MPLTCRFVRDNGQPCRRFVRPDVPFCHHHDPRRRRPAPPALPAPDTSTRDRIERGLYWRGYHAFIREETELAALSEILEQILLALGDRTISPGSAGNLLQTVEDRRRQIQAPFDLQQLAALSEQLSALPLDALRKGSASPILQNQQLHPEALPHTSGK